MPASVLNFMNSNRKLRTRETMKSMEGIKE